MWILKFKTAFVITSVLALLALTASPACADRIDLTTFKGDASSGDDDLWLHSATAHDHLPVAGPEALPLLAIDEETVLAVVPTVLGGGAADDPGDAGELAFVSASSFGGGGYAIGSGGAAFGTSGGGDGDGSPFGAMGAGGAGGAGCCAPVCFPWAVLAVPAVVGAIFLIPDDPRDRTRRIPPVPEPSTLILLSGGLIGLGLRHRRRSKNGS